jgi:hypothetical protein
VSPARKSPVPRLTYPPEEAVELLDVPAAVVCAYCGDAECAGCELEPGRDTQSGVMVFVPWERRTNGVWSRFWGTTRATTQGADAFFASLPEGQVSPALSYALVAESLAVGCTVLTMLAMGLALLWAAFPALATAVLAHASSRATIVRTAGVGWIGFSTVLVVAHAMHGYLLDRAARKEGAQPHPRLGLRFGFYAAGWDVMQSPIGILATLLQARGAAFGEAWRHLTATPGRATTAFVRGVYKLEGDALARTKRRAILPTMLVSVAAILVAIACVLLAAWT